MNTKELEEKLEGAAETPTVEFKEPMPWNVNSFAKDILALANVQDGGWIIIGIEDQTFNRLGVDTTVSSTYQIDVMRDQMTAFADPHVNFSVEFPTDSLGLAYVVIRVFQFDELPVICRKDSVDTKAGTIYYRNRNRRVESAAVSNSYDMREIITAAAIKMMQKLRRLGLTAEPSAKQKLDDELKDL